MCGNSDRGHRVCSDPSLLRPGCSVFSQVHMVNKRQVASSDTANKNGGLDIARYFCSVGECLHAGCVQGRFWGFFLVPCSFGPAPRLLPGYCWGFMCCQVGRQRRRYITHRSCHMPLSTAAGYRLVQRTADHPARIAQEGSCRASGPGSWWYSTPVRGCATPRLNGIGGLLPR